MQHLVYIVGGTVLIALIISKFLSDMGINLLIAVLAGGLGITALREFRGTGAITTPRNSESWAWPKRLRYEGTALIIMNLVHLTASYWGFSFTKITLWLSLVVLVHLLMAIILDAGAHRTFIPWEIVAVVAAIAVVICINLFWGDVVNGLVSLRPHAIPGVFIGAGTTLIAGGNWLPTLPDRRRRLAEGIIIGQWIGILLFALQGVAIHYQWVTLDTAKIASFVSSLMLMGLTLPLYRVMAAQATRLGEPLDIQAIMLLSGMSSMGATLAVLSYQFLM